MKIIKAPITLNHSDHTYSFEGMDENAIVITASELAKGSKSTSFVSDAMTRGTNDHIKVLGELERYYEEMQANYLFYSEYTLNEAHHNVEIGNYYLHRDNYKKYYGSLLQIEDRRAREIAMWIDCHSSSEFPVFEQCGGIEFDTEFGKVYLFGTCDALAEKGVVEYKTGKKYENLHRRQTRIYMNMFEKDRGCVVYGDLTCLDHLTQEFKDMMGKNVSDELARNELSDLYEKETLFCRFEEEDLKGMVLNFIKKNLTQRPANYANDLLSKKLIVQYKYIREMEEELKLAKKEFDQEMQEVIDDENASHFKVQWGAFELELIKTTVRSTGYNKDLIKEKLPEAITIKESIRRNIKLTEIQDIDSSREKGCEISIDRVRENGIEKRVN